MKYFFNLLKNTQQYKDECGNLFVLLSLENETTFFEASYFPRRFRHGPNFETYKQHSVPRTAAI